MSSLRCSSVARREGLDPLGTAGHNRGFLLVDWPLPWPADLAELPALRPLVDALVGTGIRLQGLVPESASRERRAILYHRPPGPGFGGYARVEQRVAEPAVVATAVDLVRAGAAAVAHRPSGPEPTTTGDLLVCTHGRRDTCCGAAGTTLAGQLAADPAVAAAGYALSRTSHTGGHRFAPTGIVLPEGTMWASLDRDLVHRIVARQGPLDTLLAHYRGCTGVGSPAVQAVERAAFAEVGWDWLGWRRWADELGGGRIRLVGDAPDGTRRAWTALVAERERPVPVCGRPLDEAVSHQREPVVVSIEATVPPAVTP